ncbi:MAG: ribosome assembly RNA-binding protein YhbY [Clostridia bacterium]
MITSKQRSYLRSLGNNIEPIFQIGKGGINENLIQQVKDALEARELIKITVLKNSLLDTRETCDKLAKLVGAEPVQVIGNRFILYKQSKKNQRIFLQ